MQRFRLPGVKHAGCMSYNFFTMRATAMRESGTLNGTEIASRAEVSDRDFEGWIICHHNNLGLSNG